MRKRSEIKQEPALEMVVCGECGTPEFKTVEGGVVCENKHIHLNGTGNIITQREWSKKVKAEVEKATSQPVDLNPVKSVFGNHSQPTATVRHSNHYEQLDRIVEHVFDLNVDEEYKVLVEALKMGSNRADRGSLQIAIDEAEEHARKAHQVYITAKLIKENYEVQNEPVMGSMWKAASDALEEDKKNGLRTKQITDADVKAKAACMFPDEWREQSQKLRKYDQTIKHLEHIVQLWLSRCTSVRKMSDLVRLFF